jgi:O-succinylbenzoic acid--CoA ligase
VRASTGETLSFASLDAMVDDLAGRLAALGVETGDHLGMVMETRLAAVCTVHAADRLGAVLVPVGDGLTVGEVADQLGVADVTTVVCSADTEPTVVESFSGPICSVDDADHDVVRSLAETSPHAVTPAEWDLDDTQLLLFTSGTTGEPKAVRLTRGTLLWSAVSSVFRLGLHADDRWLVSLSLHHMGGLSPVLRMPLYGMTVVLEESFDPGLTADHIGSYDVTCVSLVPTMLKRMLDLRGTLADSLRVALLGGAPAPTGLLERCRDFSVPVYPTYGMTETASQVATATPREAFDHLGTVGRPLLWTTVSVRDDAGNELEAGTPGELVVDGPTVSPGYYGNAEATSAAFGPYGLRTGDVGYRDDEGRLFVLGRVDDQIITGGENVHPQEVTDVLRAHPLVDDVAVVGVPDEEWGELVGALVVTNDDELTIDDLESYCRERLAGFKLPRVISFVDELPRTASGTVERETARDRLLAGTDDSAPQIDRTTGLGADLPTAETAETDERGAESSESEPATADAGEASTPGSVDATDEVDDTSAESETFLIGGSDWAPGGPVRDTTTEDEPDDTETADSRDEPPTEPETPDFVREVLPEDEQPGAEPEPDDDAADGSSDTEHAERDAEPATASSDDGDDATDDSDDATDGRADDSDDAADDRDDAADDRDDSTA